VPGSAIETPKKTHVNGPKIVAIGAGSCTSGFAMIHDAIIDHRLDGAEMLEAHKDVLDDRRK
jgi:hypothetical protein